jgi:hypothetical protein
MGLVMLNAVRYFCHFTERSLPLKQPDILSQVSKEQLSVNNLIFMSKVLGGRIIAFTTTGPSIKSIWTLF